MESLKIHMVAVCLGALLTGYLLGNKGQISVLFSAKPGSTDQQRPLMVSPLLKELNCGWGNMEIPNLIKKNASFTRSLVVDIGLDAGEEFFHAVDAGFEVIGFEANPESFQNLATKCGETATCKVVENIDQISLPLEREPGMSYLIQSAVGKERGTVDFFPDGPTSTSFDMPVDVMNTSRVIQVSVISLDEVIQEDVYLLKIDTEGFDYFVLQGAKNLFESFTVRQVITKVDALLLGRNKVGPLDHMSLLYRYGMQCFTARNDQGPECNYQGDSVSELEKMFLQGISEATDTNIAAPCWDDLVCINIAKTYAGDVVNYKEDDVADDVADVPEFPREWMTEALKTFEYIDKNMQDIAVPQALDMAYDRLPHGFFMRIEDGKLFINADKQMGSTE